VKLLLLCDSHGYLEQATGEVNTLNIFVETPGLLCEPAASDQLRVDSSVFKQSFVHVSEKGGYRYASTYMSTHPYLLLPAHTSVRGT
jgi:hypothetical protein